MDDFLAELRELDDTQERVEAVSEELLKALDAPDADGNDTDASDAAIPGLVQEMVEAWIDALRASDFQSERIAFLYVANHVLQKTLFEASATRAARAPAITRLFKRHLEEAVALVSNSPMDRQSVTRLLELWHEKAIFSDEEIVVMWQTTGEELPEFLAAVAKGDDAAGLGNADGGSSGIGGISGAGDGPGEAHAVEDLEAELEGAPAPALPKLNAHAANPVLDVLKKMDRHKAAIQFLEQELRTKNQFVLTQATTRYASPEELLADPSVSVSMMKQRTQECLRLIKIRNKFLDEIPGLKAELKAAVAAMITDEEAAASKTEQRLEQCDMIDIGLADLAEHRDMYPEEWSKEGHACLERRRIREEEQRRREMEMARLHQAALAESAAHAMNLHADINGETAELQSLAKGLDNARREKEQKAEQTNEMVWHPVLKELVPLQSLNLEWEDWRDH